MAQNASPDVIRFPTLEERRKYAQQNGEDFNLHEVFASVDGTHIEIENTPNSELQFFV